MVGMFASILEVKGSNFINNMFVVNNGKLTKYFPMQFFRIDVYLG
jgi:hypothetical protein